MTRSMRIRPIALCLGLGVTPSLAIQANAQYDVTLLQDAGGQGYSYRQRHQRLWGDRRIFRERERP